jgi:thiamine-phosphate pyrophosphorylase
MFRRDECNECYYDAPMLRRLSTAVASLTHNTRKKRRSRILPWLWIMSDSQRLPDLSTLITTLPHGCAVIVRHPQLQTQVDLTARARQARRSFQTLILISQDWRTAAALRCDGVHVPESLARNLPAGLRLWRKAKRGVLTTSAHGWPGLKTARSMGADLVFLSPVLETKSHSGRPALGRVAFAAMARSAKVAVGALGGMNAQTIRALNGTLTCAVAGVSFAIKNQNRS